MYVDACVPSVLNLFSLAPPESGVVDQVASEVGDNADNCNDAYGESIDGHIFDDDLDLELEELRGEAPETTEQELDHLDLHLDIPWLNPDMFNPAQRRQSAAGRSVSIRTESSPDPARYGRQNSASIQGTPNSHVPSLDPLSSEDGLEIRSFELTAPGADADPNLDASMVSLLGLDSFLDISRLGANVVHQTATIEMDRESRSFRQFVLARFDDHRSGTIAFERLLLPSYNNRRVAARAFVDLLQLASKSVFGVHQKEPYATIYISST
ncbi:R8 protein [Coemansia erecta]|uniref:R8 protein n=1 Tax=Coemansia erecta TaxID=147472 RepID=A0A9W7XYB7_9FUNG|nr:R8 protein [Coemansia erecta]